MKTLKCAVVYRLVGVLALAAMLVLAACKKDEPAAPEQQTGGAPTGEPTQKTVTGDKPTPDPGAGQAATPGTPAAPEQPAAQTPPPATGEPAQATPPAAQTPPAGTLAPATVTPIPGQVIAYGSVKSLNDLIATVKDVATKVSPMPMAGNLDQMMLQGLQGALGFQNMTWLDLTRPARIVVLNPKTNPQPGVVVLPVTDPEAVKAALPVERKEGEAGNQFTYTHDFQTIYANLSGKELVLTQAPEAFALVKEFVEKNLVGHAPSVPFEITIAMDNVLTIFGQELAMAEAQVNQMASMPMMMPMPGLQDVLKKEYELIFKGIRELERIDIAFAATDGRLQLPMTFTVKADGGLAKFIKSMAGRKVDAAALLPAASYFVMAYNFDPTAASAWTNLGFEFIGKSFQMDAEKLGKLRSLYDQSIAVTTGETAFGLYRDGNFSFAFDVIYGITDPVKAREVHLAFYGAIWNELVELAKNLAQKEGAQIPPTLDLSSFPMAVQSINAMAAPMGISLALQKEDYKGVTIDVIDLKIDYTKLPPMDADEKAIVDAILGDHVQFALAYAPGYMFESLGPNAVARVKAAIDGTKPLANDASFAHVRDLLKDGGGVLFVDPIKGLQAFATVPELAPMQPAIMGRQPQGGLVIETDAVAANQLRLTVDLATAPIGDLVKLFSGM